MHPSQRQAHFTQSGSRYFLGGGGGKFLNSLSIALVRFFSRFSGLAFTSIVFDAAPRHASFFVATS